MSEVDVVVPVLNGGDRLRACLDALAAQEDVVARVIVVDNGSTDGSLEMAQAYPGVVAVSEPRRGSYAARNLGISQGTAGVVAFTDADCVPAPTWLREGLDTLTATGADLAGGAVVSLPGRSAVGRWDAASYLNQARSIHDLGVAMTANLFARRPALERLGGFDAALRSGGDWDLCRRASELGLRLVYAPQAVVNHAPRERLSQAIRRAWLIGREGAVVGLRYRPLLWWGLSPRRLVPGRASWRAARHEPLMPVIDLVDRWVTYAGRLAGLASAMAGRR